MRGEYQTSSKKYLKPMGSPPLARGVQHAILVQAVSDRITPACAGSTTHDCIVQMGKEDHPRLRGEYSFAALQLQCPLGSPPLARGVPWMGTQVGTDRAITPACAGSTGKGRHVGIDIGDHPRLRGEYVVGKYSFDFNQGSPPLARGVHCKVCKLCSRPRITPACAGSTRALTLHVVRMKDHPRLRGEYITLLSDTTKAIGSPPLARGVPFTQYVLTLPFRITPACAGSTHTLNMKILAIQDHPRLRGEYRAIRKGTTTRLGSPPLARGVQSYTKRHDNTSGITPACAGSTKPLGKKKDSP